MASLIQCLDAWSATQPDTTLFAFVDGDGAARQRFTYRAFAEHSRALAARLCAEHAIESGDRVLLAYPPGLDAIVAFFACARIGAIPVPVPPPGAAGLGASARLEWIARDCEATALLCTAEIAAYRNSLASLPWIATDILPPDETCDFHDCPGRILFLQYTSGSTREPRGVVVSHDNVIANARSTIDHVPIGASWLPQFHDMGLIGYYLFPVVCGGTTYGLSALDFLKRPARWLRLISDVRATYASSPNFGYEYCLRPGKLGDDELRGVDLASVRVMMNAAEPVRASTLRRFAARFAAFGLRPDANVVAYGLAEATLAVSHGGRRIVSVDKRALAHDRVSILSPSHASHAHEWLDVVSCGRPLESVTVTIVDPRTREPVAENRVGEIWIAGHSVCSSYWNQQRRTEHGFGATLAGDEETRTYVRSGDLGFVVDGELFVCGRIKDVVIMRGVNHYPQDIEAAAESAFGTSQARAVVAFGVRDDLDRLIVVVETARSERAPGAEEIAAAVRRCCNIDPDVVMIVPPRTIVRTTSGKVSRSATREAYLAGNLRPLATYRAREPTEDRFSCLRALARHGEHDARTLAEFGVDSLVLAQLLVEVEAELERHGAAELAESVDTSLLQRMSVATLFRLVASLQSGCGIDECRAELARLRCERDVEIDARMRADAALDEGEWPAPRDGREPPRHFLLTGGTGFVGPFLLAALLRSSDAACTVLVRASDERHAVERVRDALGRAGVLDETLERAFSQRVQVVRGDLAQPELGLDRARRSALVRDVDAIFHNGAHVNYVLNYEVLKPSNVDGTRALLALAREARVKQFHYVSSTFIFGWTVKGYLLESDTNDAMEGLDFGYAQSKWVAEQLVLAAARRGLDARIYRPSLLSASSTAVGDRDDVAIRLLAFMIEHGIAVDTPNQLSILPVDVAADNIVAISRLRDAGARMFHVTADTYYHMPAVTHLIASEYGYHFRYYDIPAFIDRLNALCTTGDPLHPLLDFFNHSAPKIAAMRLKRYRNDAYRDARERSATPRPEPPLRDVVTAMMTYMMREGLIRPPH